MDEVIIRNATLPQTISLTPFRPLYCKSVADGDRKGSLSWGRVPLKQESLIESKQRTSFHKNANGEEQIYVIAKHLN